MLIQNQYNKLILQQEIKPDKEMQMQHVPLLKKQKETTSDFS